MEGLSDILLDILDPPPLRLGAESEVCAQTPPSSLAAPGLRAVGDKESTHLTPPEPHTPTTPHLVPSDVTGESEP